VDIATDRVLPLGDPESAARINSDRADEVPLFGT